MSCCIRRVNGVSGGGDVQTLMNELEIIFADEPSAPIVTGNNVIAGLTFEGQAVAGQTFEIVNGQGLSYDTNGSPTNTNYNFGGVTSACFLRLPISTTWGAMAADGVTPDSTWTMLVQAYASVDTIASNNAYWIVGLGGVAGSPGGSGNRGSAAMRLRANGSQCFKSRGSSGDGFNYVVDPNTIGLKIGQDARGTAVGGTWVTEWPRSPHSMAANTIATQPFLDENNHLVLAFATNGTTADMQIIIERMRVRAWGSAPV